MFFINLLFFVAFILVWWSFCGYHLCLYFTARLTPQKSRPQEIASYPSITMLVPCYNEEDYIEEKIENICALEYPLDKLKVVFLDGLSKDLTVEKAKKLTADKSHMHVCQTNCNGKINQINSYLPDITSDIIIITDVDGMMEPQTITELVKDFLTDDEVGVVGAYVSPLNSSKEDRRYWDAQNKGRLLESRVHSSSIVVGPCMAFKRGVIDLFPEDVLADDIYLPFKANVSGYKSIYSSHAVVFEKRVPTSFWETVQHKFNKCNAYLKELFRFIYKAQEMDWRWQVIYFTKILQMFLLPWLLIFMFILTCALISLMQISLIVFTAIFGAFSLLITHFIMDRVTIPVEEPKSQGLFLTLAVFLAAIGILLATGISFPFYSQAGHYQHKKIGEEK